MATSRRHLLKGMAIGGTGAALPASLVPFAAAQAATPGSSAASTAWRELAAAMVAMDDLYSKPPYAGSTDVDVAEARTYMANSLETALNFWSAADPAHPRFTRFVRPDRKVLGDNPDALYYFAPVRPDGQYVIRGNVAGADYTSFTVERADKPGGMPNGLGATLNDTEFDVASDGSYEITVGGPRRARNWLELAPDARSITTRHYFEWSRCAAADPKLHIPLTISPAAAVSAPPPPSDEAVAGRLRATAAYFNTILAVGRPTDVGRDSPLRSPYSSNVANVFPDPRIKTNNRAVGYAAADNRYFMAPYKIAPGEALEMRGRFPECRFANVLLFSRYLCTYDFENRRISLNRRQTRLEPDGSFRMVVAHSDPGVANWLDTAGREEGTIFWRFLLPASEIQPIETKVVKLSSLRGT